MLRVLRLQASGYSTTLVGILGVAVLCVVGGCGTYRAGQSMEVSRR